MTVDVSPEWVAILAEQARNRGLSLPLYVQTVLEAHIASLPEVREELGSWDETLDALAENGEDLPLLPEEAYTRESFYCGENKP